MTNETTFPPLLAPPDDPTALLMYRTDLEARIVALLARCQINSEAGIGRLVRRWAVKPATSILPWFPDDSIDPDHWIDVAVIRREPEVSLRLPSEQERRDTDRLAFYDALFREHRYGRESSATWADVIGVADLIDPANADDFDAVDAVARRCERAEASGSAAVQPIPGERASADSQTKTTAMDAAKAANARLDKLDQGKNAWFRKVEGLPPRKRQAVYDAVDDGRPGSPDIADIVRRAPTHFCDFVSDAEARKALAYKNADSFYRAYLNRRREESQSPKPRSNLTGWAADFMFARRDGDRILQELRRAADRVVAVLGRKTVIL